MSDNHDAHFRVMAEADPQVFLRVLGLFAQRCIMPSEVAMTTQGLQMQIDLRQTGLTQNVAAIISEKLRSITRVVSVDLNLIENCSC
jgi:acetolactate synthase regulatory subunit